MGVEEPALLDERGIAHVRWSAYRTLPMLTAAPEEWLDFSVARETRVQY